MKKIILMSVVCFAVVECISQTAPIYTSPAYSIYNDKVVQGNSTATVLSSTEMMSDYQSPANLFQSTKIAFKFSINGKDNEMIAGTDHHFNVANDVNETPVIKFGEQLKDMSGETNTFLKPDTKLTIKVDMSPVLSEFKAKGYYTTFKGDKIYKEDFKGLYVAGGAAPMMWDFDNLFHHQELELKDTDGDGIYETTLVLNSKKDEKQTDNHWKLSKDVSAFPQYQSPYLISDAIYNMTLEEMIKAVEPDSTFRTGKEWAGVWTRDISYSIILSMAYLQPEVAKKSLMRKVNKKKKIIQDTGTGGAWPCSTDRMIWATAAWEIYKATGDEDWLKQSYEIIENSITDDEAVAYDKETGLVKGESSFLDWREQTYPKWMQPADIYESENLGTNAVHFQANTVLAAMAKVLNNKAAFTKYSANAAKIKAGINKYLWIKDKGYYAQFLYGRNYKIQSPKSEALGEALCVLFDIATPQLKESVVQNTPVTNYGISCVYPQIRGIAPYHNNAVWPFVQSYWALASAKAANEKSVMECINAVYRPSALFLTNKENFVADNGDFAGTVINSSNMLWSLSGNMAIIHKIIFGIEFKEDGLLFHPFVPLQLKGTRSLTNFKYRNAVLNITMEGYGNKIRSFTLDGKTMPTFEIPATLTGQHDIKIILTGNNLSTPKINKVENYTTLSTPVVEYMPGNLQWQKVENVKYYKVIKNGKPFIETTNTKLSITTKGYAAYQVIAMDKNNISSFASEPVVSVLENSIILAQAENQSNLSALPYKGFAGRGFAEISTTKNTTLNIIVNIPTSGTYAIDYRYANGNGPVNTENKCAIRTLVIDKVKAATIIFPQRGTDEWSNWGFSNSVKVKLNKGKHTVSLQLLPANDNMNLEVNAALVDYLRIIKL